MERIKSGNRFFLVITGVFLFVPRLLYFIIDYFNIQMPLVLNLNIMELLVAACLVIFLWFHRGDRKEILPLKKLDWKTIGMCILLAYLCMPLITVVNLLSQIWVENTVSETLGAVSSLSFPVTLLSIAVIPAIVEECLCRGVFYGSARSAGVLKAAVASAVIFALIHRNFNQFSYALVLGLIFALLVEVTGSLFSSMIVHFVVNGHNVVMMEVYKWASSLIPEGELATAQAAASASTGEVLMSGILIFGVIATITTAIAIVVFIWIGNHNGRLEHVTGMFKEWKEKKTRLITPSWVVAAVLLVGYMVYYDIII